MDAFKKNGFLLFVCFFLINLRLTIRFCGIPTVWLTFLILLVCLFLVDYKKIRWDFFLIIPFFFLFIHHISALNALMLFLIVYSSRDISFKSIVLYNVSLQLFFLLVNFILLLTGIIKGNVWYSVKGDAYDFGYLNPNSFSFYIFYILLSVYILLYRNYRFLVFLIILPASLWAYYYTKGRTGLILECILIFTLFFKESFLRKYVYTKAGMLLFPLMLITGFFFFSFYVADYGFLNELLSGRLIYSYQLYEEITLPDILLGMSLPEEIVIDSAYINMFLVGGLYFFILFVSLYFKAICTGRLKTYLLTVILIFIISGLVENSFVNVYTTTSVVFWIILYKGVAWKHSTVKI